MKFFKKQKGITLLETVVAVAIIGLALSGLMGGLSIFLKTLAVNTNGVKAQFLLDEGIEAVRHMRDISYATNISSRVGGSAEYFIFQNGVWGGTGDSSYIDETFERTFVIEEVKRDANDDIAETGTIDVNTAKIIVSVSWNEGSATTTRTLSGYITNLFE